MGSEAPPPPPQQLHGFFFPLMAYGHMIPMFDVARMFAARGVKATIITTPINASTFSKKAERDRLSGLDINIQILRFPTEEAGLPEGCENVNDIDVPEMIPNFFNAINMLQEPLEKLFEEFHPDFIVADMFLYWATESAGKFGIPRFVFHGTNIFLGLCGTGLPDKIEMTRLQVPDHLKLDSPFSEMLVKIRESEIKSYGPAYADYYRNVMGRRAWQIGPVSLLNRNTVDKAQRGKQSAVDEHYVLNWLDSKEPNSVLYICFGSTSRMNNAQLLEIAMALEDSSVSFVWVIRTTGSNKDERFLPEGYEEKMEGKGMIIREWAPQVLILDHPSVGGFMTHCGWNSTLEGVSAGVPMITWPLFAEQFHNEKLVTQVLKTGIPAGAGKWQQWLETKEVSVHKEKIENAIQLLMGDGKEAKEMRRKAKELGAMARKAVEDGGSSYTEFTSLIEELLFAYGVKATIITTPRNASTSSKAIGQRSIIWYGYRYPKLRPDAIVADMFIPWTTETAGKFGIPRIVFHGTCLFSLCVSESLRSFQPDITSEKMSFLVPGLPDKIEMTMSELPEKSSNTTEFAEVMERIRESEMQSYGAIINSFYELEPAYANHYTKVMGRKAWQIGPVSLRNEDAVDKVQRGKNSSVDEHCVLSWFDTKETNSDLYVCFGSVSRISNDQLIEIAMGLEDSEISFVWVIRKLENDEQQVLLPEGFEDRIKGKGLIITDWAPQVLILDHPAVGGFMTHCGWNSVLEGITAGVPLIAWPVFGEQFHNQKFVTEVAKIGIQVGVEKWNFWVDAKNSRTVWYWSHTYSISH
ncbi:hypothetical protein MKW92_026931 [Papaver armeniacum]|nr:hypothetical protein MKW92_026931 [Papaver armeniacum]